jgi:hypothetical protein
MGICGGNDFTRACLKGGRLPGRMAGGHQAEKSRYGLDIEGFLLADNYRNIAELRIFLRKLGASVCVLRQGKLEDGAFSHLALGPNAAAMPVNNALNYGQANARAFIFISTVQSLEGAKDFISITLIKADTVVFDIINIFASLGLAAYLNDCGLLTCPQGLSQNLS